MSHNPNYDDEDNSDDSAKEEKAEMFSVSGEPPKPTEHTLQASMQALFGGAGIPKGVKTISSTETKNQYAVIAKKGNRELAMCCSLIMMHEKNKYFALKLRLLETHDGSAGDSVFGLEVVDSTSYNSPDGLVHFLRASLLVIPLVGFPSSPSEIVSYLIEKEVGAIIGEALIAKVAKHGGEMLVPENTLYELVVIDSSNLPNQPTSLFNPQSLLEVLGLKQNSGEK